MNKRKRIAALVCLLVFLASVEPGCFAHAKTSALDKQSFAASVSDAIRKSGSKRRQAPDDANDGCLRRLVGKAIDAGLDLRGLHADTVLFCEDGRFFLQFSSEEQAIRCMQTLRKDERVLYIDRDAPMFAEEADVQERHLSYGPEAIGADAFCGAYASGELNESVVAVIDSGVANIEYLQDRLTKGYDFVDNDNDASNDTHPNGHGTFLASEIADCAGDMPVKIMPIRVLKSLSGSMINVINGIYYAVDNGADVINISLGGKLDGCTALEEAIAYAIENGVTVVTCAGNERSDTASYCPAHIPAVITVSAVDSENRFASSFSNYGDCVDFSAPGVDIIGYNAKGVQKTLNGTSMSAAFVSAAAAMVLSANPALNPDQVESFLKLIGEDRGEAGRDPYYGWGTIRLQNAASVSRKWVESVALEEHAVSMEIGAAKQLKFAVFPQNATNTDVTWSSSDPAVAAVDEDGTVHALTRGTAQITVRSEDGGYTDICQIEVSPKTPRAITIISLPNKTEYKYGEAFSVDGMVVEVDYGEGRKECIDVADLEISGFSPKKTGVQTITVSYLGVETNFEVQVQRTFWQTLIWLLTFQWVRELFES